MKQVIRKGLKDIIVDEVPDPVLLPHHVLVRPLYSLISSGTETASIHRDSLLKEVADNPSHLRKIWDVAMKTGPVATIAEVRAKFSEYAVLGYSGAGVVAARHATVTDLEIGERVAYGGEGTGHGETILVGRNLAARMPEGVGCEHACFATLGSIAMNAVRTARIELGDVVAVIGLGLVGQLVAQLVRLQGGVVVGIDLNGKRVDMARGARRRSRDRRRARAGRRTRRSPTAAAWIARSWRRRRNRPRRRSTRLSLCRDRGRICIVGAVGMEFPWNDMYLKEIQLYMSRAYGPGSYDASYEKQGRDYPLPYVRWTENRNMEEFLRLIAGGTHRRAPADHARIRARRAAKAYDTIFDPAAGSLAVLLRIPRRRQPDPVAAFAPVRKVIRPATARRKGDDRIRAGRRRQPGQVGAPAQSQEDARRGTARGVFGGRRARARAMRCASARPTPARNTKRYCAIPQVDAVLIASRNQHHARASAGRAARGQARIRREADGADGARSAANSAPPWKRAASSSRWASTAASRLTIAS